MSTEVFEQNINFVQNRGEKTGQGAAAEAFSND